MNEDGKTVPRKPDSIKKVIIKMKKKIILVEIWDIYVNSQIQ